MRGGYGSGGRHKFNCHTKGSGGLGWFNWVMELRKDAASFGISISCGRRGSPDPQLPYSGGNGALHLGEASFGHALENMECFPTSKMLETGKEAKQQLNKEAMIGCARPHASFSDDAGTRVRSTSC